MSSHFGVTLWNTPRTVWRCIALMAVWRVAALMAVVFVGVVGYAKLTGHWNSAIPDAAYRELVPAADSFAHPR